MISDHWPDGFQPDFEFYLFNQESHRQAQNSSGWRSFYWLDTKRKIVKTAFHCHVQNRKALSPYRATFGGLDFSNDLSPRHLHQFMAQVIQLLSADIDDLQIVLAPQNFSNVNFTKSYQTLASLGFKVTKSEYVAAIPVSSLAFDSIIHKSERKKLKRTSGFNFQEKDLGSLNEIYDLVAKNRASKNRPMTLTNPELKKWVTLFPEKFKLFGLYDNAQMVAAAVCIAVTSKVLYVFYGAHLPEYDKLSPAVQLHNYIYQYAQQHQFKFMDLGTSPEGDQTNFDLLEFKQYIGAELGLKITFNLQF